MEISVMGTSDARTALVCRDVAFCKSINNNLNAQMGSCYAKIHFCKPIRFRCPQNFIFKAAAQSEMLRTHKVSANTVTSQTKSKPIDGVRLYVGLPLDSISICNTINHARAIMAGLRALKLLGVDGVELPVWWGIAEKEAMGIYEWSGYLALVEMVQKAGLKLHVSLCFHASKEAKIPLPKWVSQIGESQPNIFFTDRLGQCYKECLSLAVDELPVLDGNTPIQLYQKLCESFKSSFSAFMGSTITGISIGLGPDGVLQYPSQTKPAQSGKSHGAGEFQCYDENMLDNLKQHAEAIGNPLWGLSGPHDVPSHDQSPISNFFEENGGPWESPYGDFFLSWYSSQLISHADRMLSIASSTFSSYPIAVSGKVPLVHSWYKTRSHPSELTAGLYNTVNRDGYEEIIEVFSRNSCLMILPGMDLLDDHQSNGSHSSPELLLSQITSACRKHGVEVLGQNSVLGGFEQIKKNLVGENQVVDLFTYQRMGASFFSPDHFPLFSAFVQGLHQPEFHSDDLRVEVEEDTVSIHGKTLQLQAA